MNYEIKWTRLAKEDYSRIVRYLYDTWGDRSAEKFTDNLQASLQRLKEYPLIGKQGGLVSSMRELVLSKHHKLFYVVFDNIVLTMNIVNTARQR